MSKDINTMGARSGKIIKSDNTVVNEGDGINDDGSQRVQLTGSSTALDVNVINQVESSGGNIILQETQTEADAVSGVLTFSENIQFVEIFNADTVNQGIFNVNGLDIHVPTNSPFLLSEIGGTPRNTISVSGSTDYVVNRYEKGAA